MLASQPVSSLYIYVKFCVDFTQTIIMFAFWYSFVCVCVCLCFRKIWFVTNINDRKTREHEIEACFHERPRLILGKYSHNVRLGNEQKRKNTHIFFFWGKYANFCLQNKNNITIWSWLLHLPNNWRRKKPFSRVNYPIIKCLWWKQ